MSATRTLSAAVAVPGATTDREGEENRGNAAAPAERGKDRGPRLLKPHRPVLGVSLHRNDLGEVLPDLPVLRGVLKVHGGAVHPPLALGQDEERGGQDDLNRREHAGQEGLVPPAHLDANPTIEVIVKVTLVTAHLTSTCRKANLCIQSWERVAHFSLSGSALNHPPPIQ